MEEQVTSVSLPVDLYRKVKRQAAEGEPTPTFRAVVVKALEEYFSKSRRKGGKKR